MARVLLIEPSQPLARLYKSALEQVNHEVIIKGDAEKAVFAADGACPDIVVLELQLPGHSGVEFLYEFRSYPDWHNIPAILHTMVPPHHLNLSKQMLDRLNITAYLYKPATTLKILVRTLDAALAMRTPV